MTSMNEYVPAIPTKSVESRLWFELVVHEYGERSLVWVLSVVQCPFLNQARESQRLPILTGSCKNYEKSFAYARRNV